MSLCEPKFIDMDLLYNVDRNALYEALVALGDDVLANLPPIYRGKPDNFDRRLIAFGYCYTRIVDNTRTIGIYGDYTSSEDDERLFPVLAPFLHPESRYIFEYDEPPDDHPDRYGYWGWSFHDGAARLREAERFVEWGWRT